MNTAGRNPPPAVEPVKLGNASFGGAAPGLMDAPMPVPSPNTEVRTRRWLPS